ncbi:MAG: hypothetical protein ACJAQ3_003870 [Planctomycetota bacterium]
MKVFLANDWLASKSGLAVEGWCEPWTVSAIRSATAEYLQGAGALASGLEEADLVLVDLVDQHAALAAVRLGDMAQQARAAGRKVVLRLHGAWRSSGSDFLEGDEFDLSGVWECADAVLVASRSHLVRLASAGGIDAAKTKLCPVAFSGSSSSVQVPSPIKGARTRLLVAGETHREAIQPVLDVLKEADPGKARFQIVSSLNNFQEELSASHVLLVPATETFGDRSLVDAALRAGVAVVASECASAIDAPLPPGVFVASDYRSSVAWREALEEALRSSAVPEVKPLGDILNRQFEILSAIHGQGGATGSHFGRQAAA